MKNKMKSFSFIVALCGIAGLIGFFLFPIFQMRQAYWNSTITGLLEEAGSMNVSKISAYRVLSAIFDSSDHPNIVAQWLGFNSALDCVLLYGLPVIGSIGLIVFGVIGNKTFAFFCGVLCEIMYILQIITLPEIFSLAYKFSTWQYLLIVIAAIAIAVGVSGFTSISPRLESLDPLSIKNVAEDSQGRLIGIAGEYKDASVTMKDGERVTIGRDAAVCNLVLKDQAISRIHCYVTYIADKNGYTVRDVSRNGVFDMQGAPIAKNMDVFMSPGSRIRIGKSNNEFRLG